MLKYSPLKKRRDEKPTCSAVIVAAGSSQRMGSDKIMMKLGAMPVLARTVLAFENNEYIDEIIIVTRTEKLQEIADMCHKNGLHKVRAPRGGADRHSRRGKAACVAGADQQDDFGRAGMAVCRSGDCQHRYAQNRGCKRLYHRHGGSRVYGAHPDAAGL